MFGFICIVAMVVVVAGVASQSHAMDISNTTDQYGNGPTEQINSTSAMVQTTSTGGYGIASGLLLFAAIIITAICIFGGWIFFRQPKW